MLQKIFGLGATGIVGTLIVAGIILTKMNIAKGASFAAIVCGVVIGIILGILGTFGVTKKLLG